MLASCCWLSRLQLKRGAATKRLARERRGNEDTTGAEGGAAPVRGSIQSVPGDVAGVPRDRVHPAPVVARVIDPTPPDELETDDVVKVQGRPVDEIRTVERVVAPVVEGADAAPDASKRRRLERRGELCGRVPALEGAHDAIGDRARIAWAGTSKGREAALITHRRTERATAGVYDLYLTHEVVERPGVPRDARIIVVDNLLNDVDDRRAAGACGRPTVQLLAPVEVLARGCERP